MCQIATPHQGGGQFVDQCRKERMPHGGHQQSDTVGLIGFQTTRVIVHPVIQFLCSGFHTRTVFVPYGKTVEHPGNRTECDPGFAGNVFHSRL